MLFKRLFLILGFSIVPMCSIYAQNDKLAYLFTGVVYDEFFAPLPYTHVMAKGTGIGDVTDSLGIFSLYVRKNDQLLFYNISYKDDAAFISIENKGFYIKLKKRYYLLKEARVYNWGSTYGDFLEEVRSKGEPVSEGEKLGLPAQDPDYIPFNLDEKKLKSVGFLLSSPVSFFYYNLNKREKSIRKAYQLEKDKVLIEKFDKILSEDNISYITELTGDELETFIIYLNAKLVCTYHCSELLLLTEIYDLWRRYQLDNAIIQ